MNVQLFNDNGCETPNEIGIHWAILIGDTVNPLIEKALEDNISLRDLSFMVSEHVSIRCAEERLRKGINESRLKRNG